MAYSIRFPENFAAGLDQTWRFDRDLYDPQVDYLALQQSIIDRYEPLRHILARYLKKGDVVLETGCGSGRWVAHLNREGCRCIGVDISTEIVTTMIKRNARLEMVAGNVLRLPIRSESCDAVLSSYVFEHFRNGPRLPLREAYRVLRPGGILVFIVPFNSALRKLLWNPLLDLAYHYYDQRRRTPLTFVEYRFGRKECLRFLAESGFENLMTYPDEYEVDWNKGVTVDYRNLQFYWPALPSLPEAYKLPKWAHWPVRAMQKLYRWSCCGGIVCVARKPMRGEA
jgi:ubiquinone/menaquinone biosynthesis C-methylase UbiE